MKRWLAGLCVGLLLGWALGAWGQGGLPQVRIYGTSHAQAVSVDHSGNLSILQAGAWTIAHIGSAVHVAGTVTARQGFTVADVACHETTAIHQTSSTQIIHGTGGFRIGICGIVLVSAHAQGLSIKEGLGTTCATGQRPLIGSIRENDSVVTAAGGGFSSVAASPWLLTQGVANNVCVMQTGSGTVSGVITWRPLP